MAQVIRSPNLGDEEIVVRFYARPEPRGFAEGGLAAIAEEVRMGGRGEDDVLLHITPEEFEWLKEQWGEPDINPETGLPEYGFLSKLWKKVKKVVKKIAPIALPFLLPGAGGVLGGMLGKVGSAVSKIPGIGGALGKMAKGASGLLGKLGGTGAPGSAMPHEGIGPTRLPAPTGLGGILGRAGEFVKKHPYQTAIGGALLLNSIGGSRGAETSGAPPLPPGFGDRLPQIDFNRTQNASPLSYYTYGEMPGGEHQFFQGNELEQMPTQQPGLAEGGMLSRLVRGPGTGRSDDIPARLSDGEYVFDAETVALLGDGSTDEGARRLDTLRENIRKHKGRQLSKGKFSAAAKPPEEYMGE